PDPAPEPGQSVSSSIQLELSENVLDMRWGTIQFSAAFRKDKTFSRAELEAAFTRRISWREHRDVYSSDSLSLLYEGDFRFFSVGDWEKFWGQKDTGSLIGPLRGAKDILPYLPGGPLDRLFDLTRFRLVDGSAGKGAGKGGRDLGADVDVVGPGS